jgi:hypothetical protein
MINKAEIYKVFVPISVVPMGCSLGGGEMWGGCDLYHGKIGRKVNKAWPCRGS